MLRKEGRKWDGVKDPLSAFYPAQGSSMNAFNFGKFLHNVERVLLVALRLPHAIEDLAMLAMDQLFHDEKVGAATNFPFN